MTTSPMVGAFRDGVAVKYAWIQEHQDSYPVQKKLGDCPRVFSRLIHLANALFHDESHFNDLRPERIPLSKLAHAPIDSA